MIVYTYSVITGISVSARLFKVQSARLSPPGHHTVSCSSRFLVRSRLSPRRGENQLQHDTLSSSLEASGIWIPKTSVSHVFRCVSAICDYVCGQCELNSPHKIKVSHQRVGHFSDVGISSGISDEAGANYRRPMMNPHYHNFERGDKKS